MHIFLVGFMASGKTTVGRHLAAARGCRFVDLDDRIERRAGLSIQEIFARRGESHFRSLEHETLREVATLEAAVVATGGGTVCDDRNVDLMRRHGVTVWLDVPFDTIVRRIERVDPDERPLYANEEQARELFRSRLDAYGRADERVRLRGDESAAAVAARVDRRIDERQSGAGGQNPAATDEA